MTRVKIAELKDNLSLHLRAVEHGAVIEVTDRDRPIARIVPLRTDEHPVEIIPARRPLTAADRKLAKRGALRVDSLALLLEERREV